MAGGAALRTGVIVQGDHVVLGDLFDNAGDKASVKVAYSPPPGKQTTYDVYWLFKLARAHGLNWRPLNMRTRSTVKRESQIIERDEIEDELIAALRDKGVSQEIEIAFSNRRLSLHVAIDRPATVGVENLVYSRATGRFSAVVQAPAKDPTGQRVRVTGRVHELITVPVLTVRKGRNEIIGRADIEWLEMRKKRIRRDTILDAKLLIGKAARSLIREGRPITRRAVRRPVMVAKGSMVTINLASPFMRLTAQGRALRNGGRGDVIRVINTRSNKIIEARVDGPDNVSVRLASRLASR